MIKMKYLWVFLIALCGLNLSAMTPKELNEKYQKIVQMIDVAKQDFEQFCKKGSLFIDKTIRSYEGKYCREPLGASVAVIACEDRLDFRRSTCSRLATRLGIDNENQALDKISTLVWKDPDTVNKVCKLIDTILPGKLSCDK